MTLGQAKAGAASAATATSTPQETAAQPRAYRAVCFDLDGTLLPQDLQEFLGAYFKTLAGVMAQHGVPGTAFQDALNSGIKAMLTPHGSATNDTAFWDTFLQLVAQYMGKDNLSPQEWRQVFDTFYETAFGTIGAGIVPDSNMVQAVGVLQEKGYPLVLTTMPLFPPRALEWRLQWAGLKPGQFLRLTTYENSTSVKPRLEYYAENLAAMALTGQDVLMVGNNTVEDLSFTQLGADAYLITNHLLDPINLDLDTVRHGRSEDFLNWVNALPVCTDPVQFVDPGVIDAAQTAQALQDNLVATPEELAQAARDLEAASAAADRVGRSVVDGS